VTEQVVDDILTILEVDDVATPEQIQAVHDVLDSFVDTHVARALSSRPAIDLAKGMVMVRAGVGDDEAFALLAKASQAANVKVRELAVAMVGVGIGHDRPVEVAEKVWEAARALWSSM
jgi:ANTAR domain